MMPKGVEHLVDHAVISGRAQCVNSDDGSRAIAANAPSRGFDVEGGLLVRRVGYTRTLIGTIPQQTDFEEYREVEALRLPFTMKMSVADPGSLPIIRKFTEIKLNIPLSDSKFAKPLPNATVP